MKLRRSWLYKKYDVPTPWGQDDKVKIFGDYVVVTNHLIGWCVYRYNKEEWKSVFQELKSHALSIEGNMEKAQYLLYLLLESHHEAILDNVWNSVSSRDLPDSFELFINVVPAKHRHLYRDSNAIVQDYPEKILRIIVNEVME